MPLRNAKDAAQNSVEMRRTACSIVFRCEPHARRRTHNADCIYDAAFLGLPLSPEL